MTTTAKNPQKMTVAQFITHKVNTSERSQVEIAKEAGFEQKNMISMLKAGTTKLAMTRIPSLARALRVDPKELLVMCMEEYTPEVVEMFKDINGQAPLTNNENKILGIVRAAAPNHTELSFKDEIALHDFISSLPSVIAAREQQEKMTKQDANSLAAKKSKGS